MAYPNLPCRVCGSPGGQPCVSLQTGKPIKNFHQDGRVVVAKALRLEDLRPAKE